MRTILTAVCVWLCALPVFAGVEIDEFVTEGGLNVWHIEEHAIPFVALELSFKGGTSLDAPEKRGATSLMAALIEEGAGGLDARAFAKARDALAASFSFGASDDYFTVSARFLSENREEALALLRLALTEPRFDEASIERVRAQVLSSLKSDETDPSTIAGEAFAKRVFGNHPYGSSGDGTLESVASLTRDDLVVAFEAAVARDRLSISVVGDVTREELGQMLDELLVGLPATGADLPAHVTPDFDGKTEVIGFPTPQSVVLFGQSGIAFEDPDFFAAYLLLNILGGSGVESRLMHEVREKRGLTYGVYAYLANKDGADTLMGSVQSANDRVVEAITVIRSEWERLARDGVTEKELEDAKTYMTGSYPLRFDGNGPIARVLVGMQALGVGREYVVERNARVNAVTLEQINRVAKELIKLDELSFTVVGQPEGLVE